LARGTAAGRQRRRLPLRVVADLCRVARPSLWMVTLLPFGVGHLLATRALLPGGDRCLPGAAWLGVADCLQALRPALTGAVVFGPLVWLAVLAVNDAHDLPGDRGNPRKSDAPVTSGRLSARGALLAAYGAAAAALAAALTVNLILCLVTLGFLVLGWAYSVPPVRLKNIPGLDVVTNSVAVGGLALIAGWVAVRPPAGFPPVMIVEGLLVTAALYIPTTLADVEADRAGGYTTIAVRLGARAAYAIGLAAWAGSCALAIGLAAADHVIPRRMLAIQLITSPILIGGYHRVLGGAVDQARVVRGIVIVSWLFMIPNTIFALMYVGVL
jgi:4-hydroxybenzoate polyprenyltransferase